ncbi:MAG: NAD-dependent epimerase/dehydratase family protein [Bacteroidota bacterium]
MKRLLVLGGSQQIGRRLIEKLITNELGEYEIYTFNRGKTNPNLFNDDVHKIFGDRNTSDIEQILKKDWDVVLDCSCYAPIPFQRLLDSLTGYTGRYIFISTVSVYDYKQNINKNHRISESFTLRSFTDEQIREQGLHFYGEKKVAAEKYLRESSLDSIIFRPHFIYGKYDWQNLDYYWINRIQKYDKILVPGGYDLIHRTYVEDLISILIESFDVERHQQVYNVVTHEPITINEYLGQLRRILNRDISFITVESKKLSEHGIRPIIDIPLWSNGSHFTFSNSKLKGSFKTKFSDHYSSLQSTCAWNEKITEWKNGKSKWEAGKLGLSREKETEIMKLK